MNPTRWRAAGRTIIRLAGVAFLLQALLIAWGPPAWLGNWLSGEDLVPAPQPRYIIVLDGGGMPSAPTLLRLWHAAEYGRDLTNTIYVVALPSLNPTPDSGVVQMRDELTRRGIPVEHVLLEPHGLNTYQQLNNVRALLGDTALTEPVVIVTSGYHVRRALLCLKKAGFEQATALAARSADENIWPGPLAWLRYGIWNNAKHLTEVCRELVALAAYKASGWI